MKLLPLQLRPKIAYHVLGLKWDDVFTLVMSRADNSELKHANGQRTLLSFVSAIFVPVGIVALYTLRSRLLAENRWLLSGQK